MEYRVLGKTGLSVSRMGLGGIPIQRIDAEGARKLVHRLAEVGVNFIDTAKAYSVSEEYLGYALEGVRDKFVLASKSTDRTRAGMARDIEDSLTKLRTDHIELYQIHNPGPAQLEQVMAPGGALEALLEAKAAGKIGHIGLTCHSLKILEQALELPWVETVMFPYNIVEIHGKEVLAKAHEKNIGVIDMKPLAGGAIEDVSLALRFISADPSVDVIIPGMAEERELFENLAAVEQGGPFTPAELDFMENLRREMGSQFCRRCNYCAPCTAGINIPNAFVFHGYLTRYDLADWARERYDAMGPTAGDCIGCGACEPRCPYELPIREMLKKVAADFGK